MNEIFHRKGAKDAKMLFFCRSGFSREFPVRNREQFAAKAAPTCVININKNFASFASFAPLR